MIGFVHGASFRVYLDVKRQRLAFRPSHIGPSYPALQTNHSRQHIERGLLAKGAFFKKKKNKNKKNHHVLQAVNKHMHDGLLHTEGRSLGSRGLA